ncbi:hypothetical protein [Emticicia sp. SJ17W-69]|uniref:hypothetical protein n=1 Tax=Emticicia sp. SJ17W-69 TaxID=3421657 RepID=UPI003EB96900
MKFINNLKSCLLIVAGIIFSQNVNAQLKVGSNPTNLASSAVLEVESTNKGVLLPRIALTSITDQVTIPTPATGLLVYNTGAAGLTYKGYVFWDGSKWIKLDGSEINTNNNSNADITSSATVGPLFLSNENISTSTNVPGTGYVREVTSPDGKFSVRVKVEAGVTIANSDLQIRSNIGTPTIIWNNETHWIDGIKHNGNNATTIAASGIWYGNGGANGTSLNDVTYGSGWGDEDVYFGGAPEFRRYTWTTTDANDKTIYNLYFFLAAPNNSLVANAINCPNGTCSSTKTYLKIEQIKASN